MNNPFMSFAMNLINRNPNIANNPRSKEMIDVIMSGDQNRGEMIATNLCQTYCTTPQQAVIDAKRFFNLP